jgi:hypothetical protein
LYSATPLQQVLTKQIAMAGAKIAMLQSPLESARNPTTAPACPMACATASVISRVESSPAKQSMHQSPTTYYSQMPAYKCSLILKITSIRNTRGCFTMLENI